MFEGESKLSGELQDVYNFRDLTVSTEKERRAVFLCQDTVWREIQLLSRDYPFACVLLSLFFKKKDNTTTKTTYLQSPYIQYEKSYNPKNPKLRFFASQEKIREHENPLLSLLEQIHERESYGKTKTSSKEFDGVTNRSSSFFESSRERCFR